MDDAGFDDTDPYQPSPHDHGSSLSEEEVKQLEKLAEEYSRRKKSGEPLAAIESDLESKLRSSGNPWADVWVHAAAHGYIHRDAKYRVMIDWINGWVHRLAHDQQFGHFASISRRGSGSFGTVFRAFDNRRRGFVALKLPRMKRHYDGDVISTSAQGELTFFAETRKHVNITVPGCVAIYETGMPALFDVDHVLDHLRHNPIWFSMQFIDGTTLENVLRTTPDGYKIGETLSDRVIRDIMTKVATYLQGLHAALNADGSRGIIHRDLKPANILLDALKNPWLTDFGLATERFNQGITGNQFSGTKLYAAPEQFTGGEVTAQTDIWAWGVIYYELLTGQLPFNSVDRIRNVQSPVPRLRVTRFDQPEYLERIIDRCLRRNREGPGHRYGSFAEILDDLQTGEQQSGTSAPGSTTLAARSARKGELAALPSPDWFEMYLEGARQCRGPDGTVWQFVCRTWLFDKLAKWRLDIGPPAVCMLGDFGVGKTAIVADIACNQKNPLNRYTLAWHCCNHKLPETLNAGWMVGNLAAQISEKLPAYREQLWRTDVRQSLERRNEREYTLTALRDGILRPLNRISDAHQGAYLLLIDGVDESVKRHAGQTRSEITKILADAAKELPPWVRLLVTSRGDSLIKHDLGDLFQMPLTADSSDNLDDLRVYIRHRLATEWFQSRLSAGITAETAVESLIGKSEGKFLYVVEVLKAIYAGALTFADLDKLPSGMGPLYARWFQHLFPHLRDYERALPVMELLVAAAEPLSINELVHWLGEENRPLVHDARDTLSQFLKDGDERFEFNHKSIFDWLVDQDASREFHVNVDRGHARLANYGWHEYHSAPEQTSRYALEHLPKHLLTVKRSESCVTLLHDRRYITTRCQGRVNAAYINDLSGTVETVLGNSPSAADVALGDQLLAGDFSGVSPPELQESLRDIWLRVAADTLNELPQCRQIVRRVLKRASPRSAPLQARIALHTASLQRDYSMLVETLGAGKRTPLGAAAEDELFIAASSDLREKKYESLSTLFMEFRHSFESFIKLWRNRRRISPASLTCIRLFMQDPRDEAVRTELHNLLRTVFDALPPLDGVAFRWVILPLLSRLWWYPVITAKWNEVVKNSPVPERFEAACTIRPGKQADFVRRVVDMQFRRLYEEEQSPELFMEAIALLYQLGYVKRGDPNWQLFRGCHGQIAFRLRRIYPDLYVSHYLEKLFLNHDVPIPTDPAERERFIGWLEMLISDAYAAHDFPPQEVLDLHERLIRRLISSYPEIFCEYHTLVGRPLTFLDSLAVAEAREDEVDGMLPRTVALMEEIRSGDLLGNASLEQRLQLLAKCFFDLFFTGTMYPNAVLRALPLIVDLNALRDGQHDAANGKPHSQTAHALLKIEVGSMDASIERELQNAACNIALLVEGLRRLAPLETVDFLKRSGMDGTSQFRLQSWLNYCRSESQSGIFGGNFSWEKLIQKFGEQAKVGLFANILMSESKELRIRLLEAFHELIEYCAKTVHDYEILAPKHVRRFSRGILTKTFGFLRDTL